jgi:hypothetical protein
MRPFRDRPAADCVAHAKKKKKIKENIFFLLPIFFLDPRFVVISLH